MYRSGESVGALLGFTFHNTFMLGYSYDWTILNKTNTYHYGSHEVVLRFDIALKKNNKGDFIGYFNIGSIFKYSIIAYSIIGIATFIV